METEIHTQDGGSDGSTPEMNLEEGKNEEAMYLVWDDLSVTLPNSGNGHARKLLNGLTGHAEPGRMMAIMGPSGSGKSTLLDSLAGTFSLSYSFVPSQVMLRLAESWPLLAHLFFFFFPPIFRLRRSWCDC